MAKHVCKVMKKCSSGQSSWLFQNDPFGDESLSIYTTHPVMVSDWPEGPSYREVECDGTMKNYGPDS